jgi:hypothetical protein
MRGITRWQVVGVVVLALAAGIIGGVVGGQAVRPSAPVQSTPSEVVPLWQRQAPAPYVGPVSRPLESHQNGSPYSDYLRRIEQEGEQAARDRQQRRETQELRDRIQDLEQRRR